MIVHELFHSSQSLIDHLKLPFVSEFVAKAQCTPMRHHYVLSGWLIIVVDIGHVCTVLKFESGKLSIILTPLHNILKLFVTKSPPCARVIFPTFVKHVLNQVILTHLFFLRIVCTCEN